MHLKIVYVWPTGNAWVVDLIFRQKKSAVAQAINYHDLVQKTKVSLFLEINIKQIPLSYLKHGGFNQNKCFYIIQISNVSRSHTSMHRSFCYIFSYISTYMLLCCHQPPIIIRFKRMSPLLQQIMCDLLGPLELDLLLLWCLKAILMEAQMHFYFFSTSPTNGASPGIVMHARASQIREHWSLICISKSNCLYPLLKCNQLLTASPRNCWGIQKGGGKCKHPNTTIKKAECNYPNWNWARTLRQILLSQEKALGVQEPQEKSTTANNNIFEERKGILNSSTALFFSYV